MNLRICLSALALAVTACGPSDDGERPGPAQAPAIDTTGLRALAVPAEFQPGQALFDANCAACHGSAGVGTLQGPPLIHIYYEPNHHADAAFMSAAAVGVRAHHWRFGDMPPVPGLGPAEVDQIIAYVRWLQREAGVY